MTAGRRLSVSRTFLLLLFISLVAFSSGAIYFLHPFTRSDFRTVKERGAAIVDALYDLNPNPDFEKTANEYLSDAGMYVDIYKSPAVSVDFMRSFPVGHELVVFGVHSGAGRRGVFYFSSEAYDESSLSRNDIVMSYGQQETTRDMLKFSRSGRRSWTATCRAGFGMQ